MLPPRRHAGYATQDSRRREGERPSFWTGDALGMRDGLKDPLFAGSNPALSIRGSSVKG